MKTIGQIQSNVGRLFNQRCFYLFVSLTLLVGVAPWIDVTVEGRVALQVTQALVLVSTVAAVGRTTMPFVIAVLFAAPALGFQLVATVLHDDLAHNLALSTAFYIAFYLVAVGYLLRYVFNPEVMTDDKLFGAAAGYLMLGIMWGEVYRLVHFYEPTAFNAHPDGSPQGFYDFMYMSFGCLTSNGPGDVLPLGSRVRSLVILEQVFGALFIALLIARLAGIYPARVRDDAGTHR